MIKVIEHLEALGASKIKPMDPTEGLWYEIKQLFGAGAMEELLEFAKEWEHFSGNEIHPVQCPYGGDPELRFRNTNNLWGKTSYAKWRRGLCTFLAKRMRSRYGYEN